MSGMTLIEVEVTAPIENVVVGAGCDGLAVIVRQHGRPIGFWMEDLSPGTELSADDMGRRIAHHAKPLAPLRTQRRGENSGHDENRVAGLTVAICTKDRPEGLARCLASIEALRLAGDRHGIDVDVLVVDNASTDPEVRSVAESFGARLVREPRPGLDFARNRAIAEARGEWMVYFDDDVVVDPIWVDGLLDVLSVYPDASAVTGLVLPYALETEAQVLFERRGGFRHGTIRRAYGRDHPVEWTYPVGAGYFGTGANTAVRVDAARAIGGFDEALDTGATLPGGGDLDFYYRLVRAGHTIVYEPSCLVFHEHRRELDQLRRQFHASWGTSFHAFIVKSWRSDREMRPAHRRYVARWYRSMLTELVRSSLGRSAIPTGMLATEISGAVVGTCGEYARSQRRSTAIRREHP